MKTYLHLAVPALSLMAVSLAAEETSAKVTFLDDVMPVLENACLNCHNPDEAKGGLDLTSFSATMAGGSGGAVVQAGNADASRLYSLMAHAEEPIMPPNKPKGESAGIEIVKRWIMGGLLETKDSTAVKAKVPTLAATVENTGARPENPAMPEHIVLQPRVVTTRGNAVTAIATSPWAPLVAIGGQKQVILYNTDTLELVGIFPFDEGFPEALSFSRNGSLLLAGGGRGGKAGLAVAWDVRTGDRVIQVGREFDTALAADISPDHSLVSLGGPGKNIKIFDTRTGEQLHSVKKHPDWLLELEYSPDGVLLASGGRSGGIYIWEAATGIEFYELKEHQAAVTGITWRGDSNAFAACSEDGQISLWTMQTGKQIKKWAAHGEGALSIDFAPDGSKLVSSGRDRTVKIWDLDGKVLREIKGFADIVTSVAFDHSGSRIITGDWMGQLKVWDAASGEEVGELLSNPPTIETQQVLAEKRATTLRQQIAKLETDFKGAQAAMEAAQKQRAAAQAGLTAAQQEKTNAEGMLAGADQLVEGIQKKVEQGHATLTAEQKKLEDLQQGLAGAKKTLAEGPARVKELKAKQAALTEALPKTRSLVETRSGEVAKAVEARVAAEKARNGLKLEVEQLPGNADLVARLGEAEKALHAAAGALQVAEKARDQAATEVATVAEQLAAAGNALAEGERQVKVAELLVAENQKRIPETQKALEVAKAQVASLEKDLAGAKTEAEAAKKRMAEADQVIATRQKPVEAVEAAFQKAKETHDGGQKQIAALRAELGAAEYLIAKWKAAGVNLVLHEKREEMETYRERAIRVEGEAKRALTEKESAEDALREAEATLVTANQTIEKSREDLDKASEDVVETGLQFVVARFLDGMGEEVGSMPIGEAEVQAVRTQLPVIEGSLNETLAHAAKTQQVLEEASKVARETPQEIEKRARFKSEKVKALDAALETQQEQERALEEKSMEVEKLEKQYDDMLPEPSGNVAAK